MIMNIKTNHAITALICGIFPGGGQFYNRQIVKGLIFFVFLVSFFSCSKDLITHGLWGLVTLGEVLPRDNSIFLLAEGIIDIAQLHGHEDEAYLARLRTLTDRPLIRAFRIRSAEDAVRAQESAADMILLDAGAGDGKTFDWSWLAGVTRPYFLAGGLNPENAAEAVRKLKPFAADVSSGVETDGFKDIIKMRAFVSAVKGAEAK